MFNELVNGFLANGQWFTFLVVFLILMGIAIGILVAAGGPIERAKASIFWLCSLSLFIYFGIIFS